MTDNDSPRLLQSALVVLPLVGVLPILAQSSDIFMLPVEGEGAATGHDGADRRVRCGRRQWVPGRLVRLRKRGVAHCGSWTRELVTDRVGRPIFLTTAQEAGRRLSILSYRRTDGRLLWETSVPEGPIEHIHPKNTQASATPTTDGERVYASFGSRGLVAVDLDGGVVWHTDVGPIENYHGTAGSPLLYGDFLITYQDSGVGLSSPRSTSEPASWSGRPTAVAASDGAHRLPSELATTTRSS